MSEWQQQFLEHEVRLSNQFMVSVNDCKSWSCNMVSLPNVTWELNGMGNRVKRIGKCTCQFYIDPDGEDYNLLTNLIGEFSTLIDVCVQMASSVGDVQESWKMPNSIPESIQFSELSYSNDRPAEITLVLQPQYLIVEKYTKQGE